MAKHLILVTGATGRQGGALIHALSPTVLNNHLENGQSSADEFHILAMTRKASSRSAQSLASQSHVTVVEGNLDSEAAIRKIFENAKSQGGIWGVFCVLAFPGLGANADGEEAQGKMVANLALEFGVSSFIFSSAERGGEKDDDKAALDRLAKVKIERHVKQLGGGTFPWTILRPGFFMENYEGMIGSITLSVLKTGLQPTTTIQLIAVDDIGYVAAGVFKNPDSFHQQILCVVGEQCTMSEQEQSYKRATGRSMRAIASSIARMLISINGHTKALIEDIERVHRIQAEGTVPEHESQIAAARKAYPGLQNFESWARQRGSNTSKREKGWNKVSVAKLASGKS